MFRSYCITIRPRDGITDETIDGIKKWLLKCSHAVAVLEKSEHERHLHAQIWTDTPKARGDICKQMQRICERTIKDWDTSQLKVLRTGVKIAYSDWYLDYLVENDLKEAPHIIVNNPPQKTMEYYPTEEEQNNVQILKTAVDQRMADLEIKCLEYLGKKELKDTTITMKLVAEYLADAMFMSRTIKCVLQQRDRKALCITLHAYMNRTRNIYLFMDKTKEDEKYEKLLSQLNIQECLADVSTADHFSPEPHRFANSIVETLDTDEEDSHL